MIVALYAVCGLMACLFAMAVIPADVRDLILENCKNSRGKFRIRYLFRETVTVSRFFGELAFVALIIACVLLFGLVMVNDYVDLDIILSALGQSDLDAEKWKENLHSNFVTKDFTQDHIAKGGTKESAYKLMRFLWYALPIMILVCFASLLLGLRLTSRVFNHAMQTLVQDEVSRNRRRIRRRYLRSTVSPGEH